MKLEKEIQKRLVTPNISIDRYPPWEYDRYEERGQKNERNSLLSMSLS